MGRLLPAMLIAVLLEAPSHGFSHEGEDHSGEGLVIAAEDGSSELPRYVPVETQILARIETVVVTKVEQARTLRVLGRTRVRPEREAIMSAVAEGRLVAGETPPPGLGDIVKKGQVLAVIEEAIPAADMVTITTERARVAGDRKQAEADLTQARRELDRVSGLKEVVPERDIAAARTNFEVAQARVESLTEQLAQLQDATDTGVLTQKKRALNAPIDGMIAQTHVTPGENVGPGKALYHIVDLGELLVEADVFENDIAAVQKTGGARFAVEAFPGLSFPAKLVSLGTTVDPLSRALQVLFAVPNPDGRLYAGMFGQVYIETGEPVKGLSVPRSALVDLGGRQIVYTKTSGEVFHPVAVTILSRGAGNLLVEPVDPAALAPGARVVAQGTYQVRMSKPIISQNKTPASRKE